MKEIQISIKLNHLKDLNEKLIIRNELSYYIEVYFASVRAKSRLIRKFPQDKSPIINIGQTLSLKHYLGSQVEFWLRSELSDSIIGAFSLPCDQMLLNPLDYTEEIGVFSLSGVNSATLCFSYQINQRNIDKTIVVEREEDLLKSPEEDKEELARKAREKAREEMEYLEAQKKLLPRESAIHLTNYYVKDKPFY